MKDIENVALVVQARTNSQRCPRKMIRPFAGTTLLDLCIEKIKTSILPESNFYLCVGDQELIELGQKHNANIFTRSEASINSEAEKISEIFEWHDKLPFKYAIMVNACCTLLETETINRFIQAYIESDKDGMFGVIEKKNYFWRADGEFLTPQKELNNTKTAEPIYEAAHCLYAGSMEDIGNDIWMGDFTKKGEVELFVVPEEETFDIDYEWQFNVAETLYRQKFRS
jgi:CMP-N-acetylneuraminic acid synthetase